MVLLLVSARTLVSRTRLIKHIALGILQCIPIISQTPRHGDAVAAFVEPESVVGRYLGKALLVRVAVMAVVEVVVQKRITLHAVFVIAHVTAARRLRVAALKLHRKVMPPAAILPSDTAYIG